jgi:hypothetical protein
MPWNSSQRYSKCHMQTDRQTDIAQDEFLRIFVGKANAVLLVSLSLSLLRPARYLQIDYYTLLCRTVLAGLFIVRDSINIRCPDSRVITRTWMWAYSSAQTTRTQSFRHKFALNCTRREASLASVYWGGEFIQGRVVNPMPRASPVQ